MALHDKAAANLDNENGEGGILAAVDPYFCRRLAIHHDEWWRHPEVVMIRRREKSRHQKISVYRLARENYRGVLMSTRSKIFAATYV